jgi:hypothetical protein
MCGSRTVDTHVPQLTDRYSLLSKKSATGQSYASSFITSKLYQFYAIYSWLQLFVGPLPTIMLSYGMMSSFLRDSEGEQAPAAVTTIKNVGMGAVTGRVQGAVGSVIRKV